MNAMTHKTPAYQHALHDPNWVRWTLTAIAIGFIVLFLCVPLGLVGAQAFSKGWQAYWAALGEPDAQSAMRLTLLTALATVPLNTLFGVAAAWAITRLLKSPKPSTPTPPPQPQP